MAARGYDAYGRPIQGSGRRRASDFHQDIYINEYDGGYYTPEPRYRPPPPPQGMRPAQIIINNENNVVDDHPQEFFEPPRHHHGGRVYVQDQQIVQVARNRSPSDSYESRRAREELERLKREKEIEDMHKNMEREFAMKAAKKHEDELKAIEEAKEAKKKAIEEYKAELAKEAREKKEKEEELDKVKKEFLRQELRRDGWTEEEIDERINNAGKRPAPPSHTTSSTSIVIADRRQQKYLMVHKKHIDPKTLNAYGIEWEWKDETHTYIYIFANLSEEFKDELFEHTSRLSKQKLLKFAEVEVPVVKRVDRDRQGRLVVSRPARSRSKSPGVKKTFFLG